MPELLQEVLARPQHPRCLRGRANDRGARPDREPRGLRRRRARVRPAGRGATLPGSSGELALFRPGRARRRPVERHADDDPQRERPRGPGMWCVSVEEEIFPSARSIEEQGVEEAERRLSLRRPDAGEEKLTLTARVVAPALGPHHEPSAFALPRRAARPARRARAAAAVVLAQLRLPRADPDLAAAHRPAVAFHGRQRPPRHPRRGRDHPDRARRRRHRPLRERRQRAQADARLRAAREDRLI